MDSDFTIEQQQALAIANARRRMQEQQPASALGQVGQQYEQPAQQQGFLQRYGQDLQKRSQMYNDIENARLRGEQGAIESGFQKAGKVGAGMAIDLGSELLTSAFRSLPDSIEQPIRDVGSFVGQAVAPVAQPAIAKYGEFATEHPRAARNIEAGINMAYMIPPTVKYGEQALAAGTKAAGATADVAAAPFKKLADGIMARTPDQLDEAAAALKSSASGLYKQSRAAGVVLNQKRAKNIYNSMSDAVKDSGRLNARLHGDTISVLDDLSESLKAGDFSFENLDQFRQLLRDVVNKNTDAIKGMNPDALKASKAIDALDDAVVNLKPIDIIGGDKTAIDLLLQGRKEWQRFRKFEQVSHMVKKAAGDPNKIRSAFKSFTDKPKNLTGFSKQEVEMMKAIANPGMADKTLKGLGRFGVEPGNVFLPIVTGGLGTMAGTGGATGGLIAAGTVARQARKYATRAEPERLLKLMEVAQ